MPPREPAIEYCCCLLFVGSDKGKKSGKGVLRGYKKPIHK